MAPAAMAARLLYRNSAGIRAEDRAHQP